MGLSSIPKSTGAHTRPSGTRQGEGAALGPAPTGAVAQRARDVVSRLHTNSWPMNAGREGGWRRRAAGKSTPVRRDGESWTDTTASPMSVSTAERGRPQPLLKQQSAGRAHPERIATRRRCRPRDRARRRARGSPAAGDAGGGSEAGDFSAPRGARRLVSATRAGVRRFIASVVPIGGRRARLHAAARRDRRGRMGVAATRPGTPATVATGGDERADNRCGGRCPRSSSR